MTLKAFAIKVLEKRYEYLLIRITVDVVDLEVMDGTKVQFMICNDNVFITINGFETGKPKVNIRNPLSISKARVYFDREFAKMRLKKPPYNIKKGEGTK